MPVSFLIEPGGELLGDIRVPGDKSISHRAIILGAIAAGKTRIKGFLEAADTLATLQAFRQMGVPIEGPDAGEVTIEGVGLDGLQQPSAELFLGNSGTSIRLLSGLLAGQGFPVTLSGDSSLSKRPMRRITEPLASMGAVIETTAEGTAPIRIMPCPSLLGIRYRMPVASAQVKSCILLAGLYAQGMTCVRESAPTRDHTERMLNGFSYPVELADGAICVQGRGTLAANEIDIPGDISSAAFFLVGATIAPGSDLILKHIGINPTRTGVIEILRLMGADIHLLNQRMVGGELVADIRVQSSRLTGIRIPEHLVPLAIDEFPALFVAAACADGETILSGAAELRVKESDRIQVMADGLNAVGANALPTGDGMVIRGKNISGGRVDAHGDHRIAMAFAIVGLRAERGVSITDCDNVDTSFPGFVGLASLLGLKISVERYGHVR